MKGIKSNNTESTSTPSSSTPFTCKWEDLSKHNREDDCWVAVDGKVYDITSWIPKHPGGKEMILLSAGRDVTNLFESYHVMSDAPAQTLKKYYVGEISTGELPRYTSKSPFYSTLRERVVKHLKATTSTDPKNTLHMFARLFISFALVIISYYTTYLAPFASTALLVLSAILHGFSEAIFSIHVMHDACHAAVTHNPKVWKYLGATFDLLIGTSFFAWNHQHVIGHHLYTNIRGADPDIGENEQDFRRVSPAQQWIWVYKYQHIYAPILYGLLSIKYRLQDWQTFVLRTNGQIRVLHPSFFNVVVFIVGKVLFIGTRIILPLYFFSVGRVLMALLIAELASGYYLAWVFQVSHVALGLDFYTTSIEPGTPASDIDEDWAIVQVRTTQDYAHGNKLTTFFSGALNYQVVHHLFPSLPQDNYPTIAPIVKQTCEEYGIPYQILPTFWDAFVSHVSYLKMMGLPPSSPNAYEHNINKSQKNKAA